MTPSLEANDGLMEVLRRNGGILAEGETLPTKPVWWLIWVLDAETRKPYASRTTFDKHLTMRAAAQDCFGMPATVNMRFFVLGSNQADARKKSNLVQRKWAEAVKT